MNNNSTKTAFIRSCLRRMWLYSKERQAAMKRADYCCEKCGVKKSTAKGKEQKMEVHHKEGVGNWEKVIELIREELLCDISKLQVLCPECHKNVV
jgi:predicted HNH restriction endonuclease